MRNLYVTMLTGGADGIVACTAAQLEQYRKQARDFGGKDRLARALEVCGALLIELRVAADARLSIEIALTKLARADSDLTLESLAERVEALELGGAAGGFSPAILQGGVTREDPAPAQLKPAYQEQVVPEPHQSADVPRGVPAHDVQRPDGPDIDAAPRAAEDASANSTGPSPDSGNVQTMSPERLLAALLTVVRRGDTAVGALLNGVSLSEESGKYHLLFPTGAEFAMRVAGGADARALISQAFEEVFGRTVEFDYRVGSFAGLSADERPAAEAYPDSGAAFDASYDYSPSYADEDALGASDESGLSAMFETHPEPNFDAPVHAMREKPVDDETAANIADALSAFGKGVTVREIDVNQKKESHE